MPNDNLPNRKRLARSYPIRMFRQDCLSRALQDVVVQPLDVVGAEQAPALSAVEGDVQERLMALALDELGAAAPGPDRFADAPDGRAARCGAQRSCRKR